MPYFSKNEGIMSILRVEKQKDRTYKFSYCEAGQTELREDMHGDQSVEQNFGETKKFAEITLRNG